MTDRRDFLATLGAAALGASLPAVGRAQGAPWPSARPITYVVPFFAGSTTDVIARIITQALSESLKQTFVVESKAGAGGIIGAETVAKAAPDGYTLIGGTSGTHAANVSLYKNLPYDPVKDFEPVSLVGDVPSLLVANPNLGVNSVADLIALLKKSEKARAYGSAGVGTTPHLAGELFSQIIGVPLLHVPYKNQSGLTDVVSGQLAFKFDQLPSTLPLLQSGKIKVLAVTSAKRIAQLPDVPTMIEAGVAGFEFTSWHAVFAPKGTPKPIVERLSTEIARVVKSPQAQPKLLDLGLEVVGGSPAELAELMQRDIERLSELIKRSGASVG
ncbi:Tripartite tricarboxylate transporter family receptor [Pigmentiphaga humi]|uniref:Tripartite tricarboxylate transporter family receptor n=1 Tax=Pigmentiphaga humi TaxID=2478468 RepID=A0A3P4B3P9_9BURK|nr:tripartite tricarboxylate transporter substrate binding protein [Pigmentiphaga humi]VCU70924.1 Tripartite tricarboxylate transporter family receptor [Pigmentiphaga humi]